MSTKVKQTAGANKNTHAKKTGAKKATLTNEKNKEIQKPFSVPITVKRHGIIKRLSSKEAKEILATLPSLKGPNKTTQEIKDLKKTVTRLEKKIVKMQAEINKKIDKKFTVTIDPRRVSLTHLPSILSGTNSLSPKN